MKRVNFAITTCSRMGRFVYFCGNNAAWYRLDTITGKWVKEVVESEVADA